MDDNAVHLDDQALPFWVEVTEDGDDDSMGILGGGNPELRMVPLGPLRKNLAATVDALQQVYPHSRGGALSPPDPPGPPVRDRPSDRSYDSANHRWSDPARSQRGANP